MLSKEEATELVERSLTRPERPYMTQEILDSGKIPKLKGFTVKPGKVSDSIHGGRGSFLDKDGERVEYENPPLKTTDGMSLRFMVRTRRISTHDISRGEIPFKDQVLALNHAVMRRLVAPYTGTSQLDVGLPDTSVVIAAENLEQIPFENVLRAYMAKSSTSTSLYQYWKNGGREFCGHKLPDNLITNGPLPYVMDTPSTKSETHDKSVRPQYLFDEGICTLEQYAEIKQGSFNAFHVASLYLGTKGVLLADTKLEHGINSEGVIVSQDELFTMDSSRFWPVENYLEQFEKLKTGEIDEMEMLSLSKEYAREFSKGGEGYTPEQQAQIAVRYIMGIQRILGVPFEPDMRSHEKRTVSGLEQAVRLAA